MKKVFKGIGITLLTIFCLLVVGVFLRILWYFPVHYGHVDLSQSYRKIDGYEDIVFVSREDCYKRTFWGLKKIEADAASFEKEESAYDEGFEKLRPFVGDEYYIEQYAFSPDGTKAVYEEIHTWGEGAPTDDVDNYYKVVDLTDGSIVTLFKGPQQFFDIYWE